MKRVLFVTAAVGKRYEAHQRYTLPLLERSVGRNNVRALCVRDENEALFSRLMLPLDETFRRNYDRIVWVDSDVEVLSPEFSNIAYLPFDDREVWGIEDSYAAAWIFDARNAAAAQGVAIPSDGRRYINSGVSVYNLERIDPVSWRERFDRWSKIRFPLRDQDILFCMTNCGIAPWQFNAFYKSGAVPDGAYAIHYAGPDSKLALDKKAGFCPRCYVSLTTHAGRAPYCGEVVESLVSQGERGGFGVCLSVQKDVRPMLPSGILGMADSGRIEILMSDVDHGSNMKYTLALRAHPDAAVVCVDDDNLFYNGSLAGMFLWHRRFPDHIICRRYREIKWDADGHLVPFTFSSYPMHTCNKIASGSVEPVVNGFPEHCGGVLYPPGAFVPTDEEIAEAIEKAPHDDDVFAHVLALRHGIRTILIHDPVYLRALLDRYHPEMRACALWKTGGNGARSTEALRRFESELAKDRR